MKRIFSLLVSSLALTTLASAQNYIEARSAASDQGLYRYVDYNHTFKNKVIIDVSYFGVSGQNELYAGVGYQIKVKDSLTVMPIVYGVMGKENRERGAALGVCFYGSIKGWNYSGFAAHFEPLAGSVPRYTFLDSVDVSRRVKKFEVGASTGFYHAYGSWNPLLGPVLIKNDERGSWRFYVRGGSTVETRLTRTFTF